MCLPRANYLKLLANYTIRSANAVTISAYPISLTVPATTVVVLCLLLAPMHLLLSLRTRRPETQNLKPQIPRARNLKPRIPKPQALTSQSPANPHCRKIPAQYLVVPGGLHTLLHRVMQEIQASVEGDGCSFKEAGWVRA